MTTLHHRPGGRRRGPRHLRARASSAAARRSSWSGGRRSSTDHDRPDLRPGADGDGLRVRPGLRGRTSTRRSRWAPPSAAGCLEPGRRSTSSPSWRRDPRRGRAVRAAAGLRRLRGRRGKHGPELLRRRRRGYACGPRCSLELRADDGLRLGDPRGHRRRATSTPRSRRWRSASRWTAIHFVAIPATGTSVNPARSIGTGAVRRHRRDRPGLAVHRRRRCSAARSPGCTYPLLFGRPPSRCPAPASRFGRRRRRGARATARPTSTSSSGTSRRRPPRPRAMAVAEPQRQ